MTHPKNLRQSPAPPKTEHDEMMNGLRQQAENGERAELLCPVCHEEKTGPMSLDGDDIRWDCPDCGPCNLSWIC